MTAGGWTLKKEVNLPGVVTVVGAIIALVLAWGGLDSRVKANTDTLCRVTRQLEEARATAMKVERIEERILGVQQTLEEIRDELKGKGR